MAHAVPRRRLVAAMAALMWLISCSVARAGLIRDAQTEAYLATLSQPVFQAAGLAPDQVRIFIVQDDALNAFVAGGSNLFLHTGLLVEAQTPEMLLGVLAHETGHIAGGHVLLTERYYGRAQVGAILTYLLGAATIAAGGGDVGAAILSGGSQVASRGVVSFTRQNEQAADQAALSYLETMGISPQGMLEMFTRLRQEEKRHLGSDRDVYALTHPLTQERIRHMRSAVESSPAQGSLSPSVTEEHALVRAKLVGFLADTQEALRRYPLGDNSKPARVARAVAYGLTSRHAEAMAELAPLLASQPKDGYLNELKGFLLLKAGRIPEAITAYAIARDLLPDSALIRSDYARALLARGSAQDKALAKEELLFASAKDPTYGQSWRLLAQLYGAEGNIGMAELSLAELAALSGDKEELLLRLDRANGLLDPYSPAGLRAEDLRLLAKTMENAEGEE